MTETDQIGFLEEEALKRKERLRNLKQQQNKNIDKSSENSLAKLPTPKFRSYKPSDESLKENVLQEPQIEDLSKEVQDQLDAAKIKTVIEELDISSLAPRKPDWDLKRDAAKKLEKLQKRTQKAIAELIIERLKVKENENLASVVDDVTSFTSRE